MRIRLAILGFVAAIGVLVAVFTHPAGGDCTSQTIFRLAHPELPY